MSNRYQNGYQNGDPSPRYQTSSGTPSSRYQNGVPPPRQQNYDPSQRYPTPPTDRPYSAPLGRPHPVPPHALQNRRSYSNTGPPYPGNGPSSSSSRYMPMVQTPGNARPFPGRGGGFLNRPPFRKRLSGSGSQLDGTEEFVIFIDSGLPRECDTLQIHSIFKSYGKITNIRMFSSGKAKVTFAARPDIQTMKGGMWTGLVKKRMRMDGVEEYLEPPMPVSLCIRLDILEGQKIASPKDESKSFPEKMSVLASDLSIGMLSQPKTIMPMYSPTKNLLGKPQVLDVKANLKNRTLDIVFEELMSQTAYTVANIGADIKINTPAITTYMIRINFARIQSMVVQEAEEGPGTRLLVHLEYPPNLYRRVFNEDRTHESGRDYWNDDFSWFRQTEVIVEEEAWKVIGQTLPPVGIRKIKGAVDIGRWTTFLFDFNDTRKATYKRLNEIIDALQEFNITVAKEDITVISNENLLDLEAEAPVASSLDELFSTNTLPTLPFEVQYQLEVCISHNYINDSNMTVEFLQRLSTLKPTVAIALLEDVEARKARVYNPMEIFDLIPRLQKKNLKLPAACIKMRRVTVTPTTMYVSTPSVEVSNRVLRQYSEYLDSFLRVQFMDEKFEGRLYVTDRLSAELLLKRVASTLKNGIRIGYRHYRFLAFGNSQFRENGAYFFAENDHVTCDSIRAWMGEFTHIRVIAKYCARLGQCFSTTKAIGSVKVDEKALPDVERNGFCFSDGVGLMSPFLSDMISHDMGIYKSGVHNPSAYQFRLGGCKGVLSVSPRAKGRDVHIRPSQKKFDADSKGLEINRVGYFCSASLNRQLILILSALGVPDHIFEKKLKKALEDLDKAMVDESTATKKLCTSVDHNRTTLYLAGLVRAGFMKCREPFLMSAIHLWKAWSIKYLKEKARIIVEDGAFLLGVVDDSGNSDSEEGVLRGHYDADDGIDVDESNKKLPEIFVQITEPSNPSNLRIIEGRCIVARNPSLHPGDIRIVNAVNRPELHHHVNVVVFPRNGDRDVPGMCSGGDLDGDDFIVIWDPEYMPEIVNYPPMDYTAPKAIEKDSDVTAEDMMNFFLNYMKNDRLGTIANCHLVWADKDGANCPNCKELAQLHSKAVDFNKTGEPAELPKRLRVRSYPHFMEKKASKSYRSHKVLGKLYDRVSRIGFSPVLDGTFDERILSVYSEEELEPWIDLAEDIKVQYDTAIKRVMIQHEINSEIEVVTGFVLAHSPEKNDYKYHEEIGTLFQGIRDTIRNNAQREVEAKAPDMGEEASAKFVAAAYFVTAREVEDWREMNGVALPQKETPPPKENRGKVVVRMGEVEEEEKNKESEKEKSNPVEEEEEEKEKKETSGEVGKEEDEEREAEEKEDDEDAKDDVSKEKIMNVIEDEEEAYKTADEAGNEEATKKSSLDDLETASQADSLPSQSQDGTASDAVETRSSTPSERSSTASRARAQARSPVRRLSDSHTRINVSKSPFVSFPWIFSDLLTRIAQGEFKGKGKKEKEKKSVEKPTKVLEMIDMLDIVDFDDI